MAVQNRASFNRFLGAIAVLCLAAPALHAQWLNYKIPGVPRTADGKVTSLRQRRRKAGDGKSRALSWTRKAGWRRRHGSLMTPGSDCRCVGT